MYNTSQSFKDAVYAPSRKTVGRVTFDITDVTAYDDVSSVTASSEAPYSVKAQLTDRKRLQTYKLATLETDRFKLDGSYSFADDTLANNGEVGFVSDVVSDSSGVFSTFPSVTITFGSTHSSAGLTITWDAINGEYATDYDVSAYDASNALITSVSITGNTDLISEPLGQLLNYKQIVITVKKWSVGNRRARIVEVDFGIVRIYSDDSLISMGLTEEVDLASATIPAAEFDFEVDNSDRLFNILNPVGFYKYLQQRQRIYPELGIALPDGNVEYIPMGKYYLGEWISNEGSLTASFTARTALDLMSGYDYEQLTPVTKTLSQLAADIFAICGIKPSDYSIDTSLSAITTNSMANKVNCKDALQMIAIAGRCNVYVDRLGVITLKPIALSQSVSVTGGFVSPFQPLLADDVTSDNDVITGENTYAEPQIFLEKIVKQVDVSYWTDLSQAAGLSSSIASGITDGDKLAVDSNTFINTSAQAQAVADWVLAQNAYRARYDINWRGNPSHELSDSVLIENSFGANNGAVITRTNITYEGYLQAQTQARGVPN